MDLTKDIAFNIWMIVYEKDSKRVENYKNICLQVKCNKFSAIDSINNFEKYSKVGLDNNYTTIKYLNEVKNLPGKLGCNLSHQMLLEEIVKNSTTDWNLILEDDVNLNNYDEEKINKILHKANLNGSKYIQLYTNNIFLEDQKKEKKIDENLYQMVEQLGTVAYFINKSAINIFKKSHPIEQNIDLKFNQMIKELKSLCWINDIFINKGNFEEQDNSQFGSLIWTNKIKRCDRCCSIH